MKTSFFKFAILMASFIFMGTAQSQSNVSATPEQVAEQFYSAFSKLDYDTMGSLYQDNMLNIFADPVFGPLNTQETRAMWAMLTLSSIQYSRNTGEDPLRVSYKIVAVQGNVVQVNWIAKYVFSETGRPVTNYIRTTMTVQNGKIVSQRDQFNLCKWTKMAFGFPKSLVCHAPSLIRKNVRKKLADFMDRVQK
jgi:ketosteroid isomerase-like protein